jgi:pimeloyl-ACP methyl ester carboxylesterase
MTDPAPGRAVDVAIAPIGARHLDPLPRPAFYDAPASVPSTPGTVIATERAKFYLDPLRLVAAPARVTRIMFSSADRQGQPIAVTGTVLTPTRTRKDRPNRGLVAFAVGTQGMAAKCAPSRQMAVGREYESVFIAGLLARGFNVVVPDYQGHGAASPVHTYMSRVVQGQVVLDAIRAAQQVDGIPDAGPVAITGYSQGGAASASAAEMWDTYAPELDVVGAVAGAPPADLYRTARFLDGGPYFAFLAYTVAGIVEDYGIDASAILNERGLEVLASVHRECLFESLRSHAFTRFSQLTLDGRGITTTMRDPQFETILRDQRLGAPGRWPKMPTMVVHSRLDDVVPYECGRALAERWVDQGARVRLVTGLAPGHIPAMATSYRSAFSFLTGRFRGLPMRANTKRYLRSLVDASDQDAAAENAAAAP